MTQLMSRTSNDSLIDVLRFVHDYRTLTAGDTPSLAQIQQAVCPHLSRETVRTVLSLLEKHGLIVRSGGLSPRTTRPISVTDKGRQLLAELSPPATEATVQ